MTYLEDRMKSRAATFYLPSGKVHKQPRLARTVALLPRDRD